MKRASIHSTVMVGVVCLCTAVLAGCGKSLSGTYAGEVAIGEKVTLEFQSGKKALISVMGQTRQVTYTIEGDKVIFDTGKGKEVYTLQKDGSLVSGTGVMSVELKKQ